MSKFVVQVINNNTSTYIVEADDENDARKALYGGEYLERNDSAYSTTKVYPAPDTVTLQGPSIVVEDVSTSDDTPPAQEVVAQ